MQLEQRGPLDLDFSIGSFPVRVEPTFWLTTALMGWTPNHPELLVSWVVICFVSILFHELGHATAARWFGASSAIRLYWFGGLCIPDKMLSRWRDLVMSAAGPVAGFLLGGAAAVFCWIRPPQTAFAAEFFFQAQWVNFGWGLINLLPLLPLDGGHVFADLLGPSRRRLAVIIGCAFGVFAVLGLLKIDQRYAAVFIGLLVFQNGRMLASMRDVTPIQPKAPTTPVVASEPDVLPHAWELLRSGDEREAGRLGQLALSSAKEPIAEARARDLLAWVELAGGNARGALRQLDATPAVLARPLTWALALEAAGSFARASVYAGLALTADRSDANAAIRVRLQLAAGELADAQSTWAAHPWKSDAQKSAVEGSVAFAKGELAPAADAFARAFGQGGRPDDAYSAARSRAKAGDVEGAVEWLTRALDAGFDDFEQVRSDEAMARVKTMPTIAGRLRAGA